MKSFVTFILSLSLLIVWMLGCATPRQRALFWVKPGGTNDALNKDIYACTQESQQRVSESSYDRRVGGSSTSVVTTNVNLYNLCMNARGWVIEEDAYGFEPKNSRTPATPAPAAPAPAAPAATNAPAEAAEAKKDAKPAKKAKKVAKKVEEKKGDTTPTTK
ncbi:MAG TPA: hypothetical protein VGJ93_04675 [Desulfuromonadaceae bacterium]|jgi:hypothetical protein